MASTLLMQHLRVKPECRDLLDELVRRDSSMAEPAGGGISRQPNPGGTPGVPAL